MLAFCYVCHVSWFASAIIINTLAINTDANKSLEKLYRKLFFTQKSKNVPIMKVGKILCLKKA